MTEHCRYRRFPLVVFTGRCRDDWSKWFAIGPYEMPDGTCCGVVLSNRRRYLIVEWFPTFRRAATRMERL